MRMCGHAHHDDDAVSRQGTAGVLGVARPWAEGAYVDREQYEYWSEKDPIASYAAKLLDEGLMRSGDLETFKREAERIVEKRRAPSSARHGRSRKALASACSPATLRALHIEPLAPSTRLKCDLDPCAAALDAGCRSIAKA
jgi:hypothetical protein